MQVTSVHGNKIVPAVVIACFTAGLMLSGGMLAQRRLKLQLEEKKLAVAVEELEVQNKKEIADISAGGAAGK